VDGDGRRTRFTVVRHTVNGENKNSKFQAPNSKQAPKTNNQMTKTKIRYFYGLSFRTLEFGTWNLFGICDLEF
jgi:hypothetical protein